MQSGWRGNRKRGYFFLSGRMEFSNFFRLDFDDPPSIPGTLIPFSCFQLRFLTYFLRFIGQVNEYAKNIRVVVFLVSKWPSCFQNIVLVLGWKRIETFWVELKSHVRREDPLPEEIRLLIRDLIGEWNRLREGDIYSALRWDKKIELFGAVLEKSHLDIFCRGCNGSGEENQECCKDSHIKILS